MIEELSRLLKAPDATLRREAALKLKDVRTAATDDVTRLLLKAMQDTDWRVRKAAIDSLIGLCPCERYIGGLVALMHIEDNAGARNSAIEALVKLGPAATAHLAAAYDTDNADVRKFIVDIIGEVRDGAGIPLLIRALRDEDENVKASAVEHLGTMKETTVIDALIGIIGEGDLWTSYPAVEALGRIGDPRAQDALLSTLENGALREPAIRALGRIGEAGVFGKVASFLNAKSRAVQYETVIAIEKFYHRGVVSELMIAEGLGAAHGHSAVDILLECARSGRPDVRVSAVLILGLMKDERAVMPLVEIASSDAENSDDVRRALVYIARGNPDSMLPQLKECSALTARLITQVMADAAGPAYFDAFMELLAHDDGHVRVYAARGLGRIGDPRAVDRLIEALPDPYRDVQEAIAGSLLSLKAGIDTSRLVDMLRAADPMLKRSIIVLMSAIGDPSTFSEICFAGRDPDDSVRQAAVQGMAQIRTPEALEGLANALSDDSTPVRMAAAISLGEIGGPGNVELLALLSKDADPLVRSAAARGLGLTMIDEAVPVLEKLMDDENGFVITTAIVALGKAGSDQARDVIIRMTGSRDSEIRRTAIKALGGFGGVEAVVLPFLRDKDWATRVAAVESLNGRTGEFVRSEVLRAMESENDSIVRSAMEHYLNVS